MHDVCYRNNLWRNTMDEIITRLEGYVNGDRSGMTQIYRDAIEAIKQRDQAAQVLKQDNAELELKLRKTREALDVLIGHCNQSGLKDAVNDPIIKEAVDMKITHVQMTEFVFELFDMVGKIVIDEQQYKCNIKSGLEHETALFALKKD